MMNDAASKYPIRDIFRKFYPEFEEGHPALAKEERKAAECIMRCKTGELGYNAGICEECGAPVVHAVSCNNRSCPCCQSPLEKKWEAERNTELIEGISYYHVVFTVPHDLNPLFRPNMALLLNLLFRCVQETLLPLCADPKFMGAKPGIISVLHTWGQKLNFHPHLHLCISGGGITPSGQFVETKHKGFFLPEAVIADMFRGKFLCSLKELYSEGRLDLSGSEHLKEKEEWSRYINKLFAKRWLPFVKETFNGKGNAIRYLARYSYRTAIANSRIVSVSDETVTFRYKDYSDDSTEPALSDSERAEAEASAQELPPKEDENFLWGAAGAVIGLALGWALCRVFGDNPLLRSIPILLGDLTARIIKRVKVDEMTLSLKELLLKDRILLAVLIYMLLKCI